MTSAWTMQKRVQSGLARQQFQQAVKINPNSNEAADAKKQLPQLKSCESDGIEEDEWGVS